jgi:hypothetical protein
MSLLPERPTIRVTIPGTCKRCPDRVRVRVTLQLTVSQSVRLGAKPNLGLLTRDIYIFFFLKVTVLS